MSLDKDESKREKEKEREGEGGSEGRVVEGSSTRSALTNRDKQADFTVAGIHSFAPVS